MLPSDTRQAYFRRGTRLVAGAFVSIHEIGPGGALTGTAFPRTLVRDATSEPGASGYWVDVRDDRGNEERWLLYPTDGV